MKHCKDLGTITQNRPIEELNKLIILSPKTKSYEELQNEKEKELKDYYLSLVERVKEYNRFDKQNEDKVKLYIGTDDLLFSKSRLNEIKDSILNNISEHKEDINGGRFMQNM